MLYALLRILWYRVLRCVHRLRYGSPAPRRIVHPYRDKDKDSDDEGWPEDA